MMTSTLPSVGSKIGRNAMDEIDELLAYYLEIDALDVGMSEDGEFYYTLNVEIAKEKAPELYDIFLQDIDNTLLELYNKGLVKVEYTDTLEARFSLTDEGIKYCQEELGL